MRLIDADALDFCFPVTDNLEGMFKQIGIGMAQARVNDAPTIDPEELRPKGRWLTWSEKFPEYAEANKGILGVFCTACNLHADNKSNYCPNCGAKMEGGEG